MMAEQKRTAKTRVHLTVDVETSMGGAWRYPGRRPLPVEKLVFCKVGDKSYGLPVIVEELKHYQFRATFFTEVFCSYCVGHDQVQAVIDYLLKNGQEVQLHLHPVFWNYSQFLKCGTSESFQTYSLRTDAMHDYDVDQQFVFISEGAEVFRGFTGKYPVAFRAGGFRADRQTLVALKRAGVRIDSSYNPSVSTSFKDSRPIPNLVQDLDGIVEVPLTNAISSIPFLGGWKPMSISAVTFAEIKAVLEQAREARISQVTLILHPFNLVKPRDMFYSDFRPDQMVISRFRRLLRFLAEHPNEFEVSTLDTACSLIVNRNGAQLAPAPLNLGLVKPIVRKGAQALDRLYWI